MALTLRSHAEQVAEHLRNELVRGRWTAVLPGIRRLEKEFGVNHNTIESALHLLEAEGLLKDQGHGRARCITLPRAKRVARQLRIQILLYEGMDRGAPEKVELLARLREAGFTADFAVKSLHDLGMNATKVSRFVSKQTADAWVISAGPRDVLEWFASQSIPCIAMSGRFTGLPIAAASPRKSPALVAAVDHLVSLGHRRIVMLTREERRKPGPAVFEQNFLNALESHGLPTGPYNLPDWKASRDGLHAGLDSLFLYTPPTALIVNEPPLFLATHQYLARRRILVPDEVSLICDDPHPAFAWWDPPVSHIRWDHRLIVRRIVEWADHVARGQEDLRQVLFDGEFVEGGTIGKAVLKG